MQVTIMAAGSTWSIPLIFFGGWVGGDWEAVMNFELDWKSIGVGAIIAAVIIKIGDYLLLSSRSAVDRELLEKRFQFDMDLAKQKFDYEVKKTFLPKNSN